jgi:hypothetical protein
MSDKDEKIDETVKDLNKSKDKVSSDDLKKEIDKKITNTVKPFNK